MCTCVQSYNAPGNVHFTANQMAYLWIQAGGNPQVAGIMAAIGYYHESGGNSTATCVNGGSPCSCNGCVDRGLWQIDSVHGAGSSYDPMTNARAAVALYQASGFQPWGGDYQAVISSGQANGITPDSSAPINPTAGATNNAGTGATQGTTGTTTTAAGTQAPGGCVDPLNWMSCMANATDSWVADMMRGLIMQMLNPIIQMVAGMAGITAGGIMIVFGVWSLIGQTRAGQQVQRGVGTAAGAGVSALGPEAAATTQYVGQTGQVTTVQQIRRPSGSFNIGGQRITYRPARVRTRVSRPEANTYGDTYAGPRSRTVPEQLNDQARTYQRRGPIHRPGEAA